MATHQRFHFERSGSGEAMILIHGLAGSIAWWGRNVDVLSQHFCVYCLDLSGFGGSRNLSIFELERIADSVLDWLDEQRVERAIFVGHSMGGLISARIAARWPERVTRLVLVDAAFLSFDAGLRRRIRGLLRSVRIVPRDFYPVFMRDVFRAAPRSLFKATYSLLQVDWRPLLADIKAPTLVVWGEHDTITPMKIGDGLVEAIPGSRIVVIENAGHNPMWDQADRFNDEVLRFVVASPAACDS